MCRLKLLWWQECLRQSYFLVPNLIVAPTPCNSRVYIHIRSLTLTWQMTHQQHYLARVVRAVAAAAHHLQLVVVLPRAAAAPVVPVALVAVAVLAPHRRAQPNLAVVLVVQVAPVALAAPLVVPGSGGSSGSSASSASTSKSTGRASFLQVQRAVAQVETLAAQPLVVRLGVHQEVRAVAPAGGSTTAGPVVILLPLPRVAPHLVALVPLLLLLSQDHQWVVVAANKLMIPACE